MTRIRKSPTMTGAFAEVAQEFIQYKRSAGFKYADEPKCLSRFCRFSEELTEVFKKALNNDKLDIKVEKMKNASVASMITVSEETRRMQDMMKMYSMGGMDMSAFGATGETLVLNANHPLVKYVLENKEGENTVKICEQLYDLASLAHGQLSPERMTNFVPAHSSQ